MLQDSSPIAVVVGADGETSQKLLAATAAECRSMGIKVSGVTAHAHDLPDRACSAGMLRDIVSGCEFQTFMETVPADTSCHLDARGVDAACASVLEHLQSSDLVILSKFGKLEAMQKGLFPAFESAMMSGKPLITTVSKRHQDAWQALAPNFTIINADEGALTEWSMLQAQIRRSKSTSHFKEQAALRPRVS